MKEPKSILSGLTQEQIDDVLHPEIKQLEAMQRLREENEYLKNQLGELRQKLVKMKDLINEEVLENLYFLITETY